MNYHLYKKGINAKGAAVVLVAGFLLILAGMNVYQYFKLKSHFAAEIITRMNKQEVEKLRALFQQVSEKLLIVHDLGENGVLQFSDIVRLNKKFFPLMENQELVSGVILADGKGREYFLYRKDGMWVTRLSRVQGGKTLMVYQKWKTPEEAIDKWEKISAYDPRKRPWFHKTIGTRQVYWSPVYKFFATGKPGVTASITWKGPGSSSIVVFALDIPLDHIQGLLKPNRDIERSGLLFLVNPQGNFFITPMQMGFLSGNKGDKATGATGKKEALVSVIFAKWNEAKRPSDRFVRFSYDSQSWLASLRPLSQENQFFWVGVAAPENVLLSDLKKALFQVDVTDVAAAFIGSILLLLIFWKAGGFRPAVVEEPEPPVVRLNSYINQGEGSSVEFKSTIRTNLRTGKKGKEIELAWLKAVVAFLNSNGGALLIGVDDKGRIVGTEVDNFDNPDKCQLHLKNLINQHIGAQYSDFINISLMEIEEKPVVLIECRPANEPVFLKIGKNEEFYVRSGPSSIKLTPSQTVSYVLQKMKKRR